MTLRKKPKTEDEFLGQGAVVPTDTPAIQPNSVQKSVINFEVRMPSELIAIIDLDRDDAFKKTSRNTWLIDAAVNELKRRGKLPI